MDRRFGESTTSQSQNTSQPTGTDSATPTIPTAEQEDRSPTPSPDTVPPITDSTVLTLNQQRWHPKHAPTTTETAGTSTTKDMPSTAELESPQRTPEYMRVIATEATNWVGPASSQEMPSLFNLIRLTPVQVGLKPTSVNKDTPIMQEN
nr:hypothetical protein CFP56_65360 [Quercus suber]